jgi:MFS family permease
VRTTGTAPPPSTWAPLRNKTFRALWVASLASNIGTWMQTVGAQWLLVRAPNAPMLVALVQTATLMPVFLLSMPSGVLADMFDRRRLLVAVQAFQVFVGVVLAAVTALGLMNPPLLLLLTFALGAGATLTVPAWQSLIQDIVPREELHSASVLGSMNVNLARAVGPAIAGLLISTVGPAAVFALNAVTFGLYGLALAVARPAAPARIGQRERFLSALLAGQRFVRYSPIAHRIMVRAALFVVPASALWALLPLIASDRLRTNASGYGVLLAALGLGAVAGAFVLPHLRRHLSTNRMLVVASLAYAGTMAVLALSRNTAVVCLALIPAGTAWIAVMSAINAAMQLYLPGWVRARALSAFLIVMSGGQAVGSVIWGVLAGRVGLVPTFLAAAGVMAVGAATIPALPMIDTARLDRDPAIYWPEPHLDLDPDEQAPVVVELIYRVPPERQDDFVRAMDWVRRSRLRTGASRWQLYRAGEEPEVFVETYSVPSWEEHLRQHGGRLTGADRDREEYAMSLAAEPRQVLHLFPAEEPRS